MDRQPILEGDRLLLRPLRPDDWDALYAVASDPLIWAIHPQHDRWKEVVFAEYFADALALVDEEQIWAHSSAGCLTMPGRTGQQVSVGGDHQRFEVVHRGD